MSPILICLIILVPLILSISKLNRTIEEVQFGQQFWYQFRADFQGVGFSGVFTDNTILQRGPELAAVYGLADSPNQLITVTLTNMDGNKVETWQTHSYFSTNGSEWKVVFSHAYNYGGNYTLNVKCDGCKFQNSSTKQTLVNITFGDIYLLTGQSNMELTMHYTFNRNITYANMMAGRYKTIRYYKIDANLPTGTNVTYVIPYSDQYVWNFADKSTLDDRSAFGWYFAQSLYDIWNITDIPIALIDVSQGGSHIEEWIQNQTVQLTCKYSDCPDVGCGYLYGQRIAPYINMTIKSYVWYQGENSCGENYNFGGGYACMQSFMVQQWRSQWSVVEGTTSPLAPFGLVTLAAGTDEGCPGMGEFRSAQLADYGYTPNAALPNVFSALGHDCGDPWMSYNGHQGCRAPPYACLILNESYIPPWNWNETNYMMGDIHPRTKKTLAQRLAGAAFGILYNNSVYDYMTVGPLISGCTLNNETWKIVIAFNETFLKGNAVDYVQFVSNGTTYNNTGAIEIEIGANWYFVQNIGINGRENENEIIVDISAFKGKNIIGLRYAWGKAPCCGLYTNNKFNWAITPCPVNSCEIKAGRGTNNGTEIQLPAVPFIAKITNNSCVCIPPQTCSG